MAYVENGYTEQGYFEGDFTITDGNKKLKVAIVGNTNSDKSALDSLIGTLADDELVFAISTQTGHNFLVNNTGYIQLTTSLEDLYRLQTDLNYRLTSLEKNVNNTQIPIDLEERLTTIENKLANCQVNLKSVTMTAPDGTVIATPDIVHDGTKFTFTVPEEAAGTQYSVVVEVYALAPVE